MRIRLILSLSFLLTQPFLYSLLAQETSLDDLHKQLEEAHTQKEKIETLLALSENQKGVNEKLSLKYAHKAIKLSQMTDDKLREGKAYRAIGNTYYYGNKYKKAIPFYEKSNTLFREVKDNIKISTTLNDIGMMYSKLGKYRLALEYFRKSMKIDNGIGDTARIAASYTNIASILMKQNNYLDAIDTLEEVLLIDSLTGAWEFYTQDLGNIATLYRALNLYDTALDYAIQGYTMADSIGSTLGAYQAAGTIADIYRILGYKENILEFAEKTLFHAKESRKSTLISDGFARVQIAYQILGNTDLAMVYFDSALVYAAPDKRSILFNNLGAYFSNSLNDADSALKYYNLAVISAQENSESIYNQIIPLINKGVIYRERGDIDRAVSILDQAIEYMKEEEYVLDRSFLKEIAETYNIARQHKKGYEFLNQAVSIQDSLLDIEQKTQDKLLSYEKRSRELTIKEQKLEIIENNQKLWRRTALIFILGFVLFAIFLITYLLKKKNEELAKLNVKLEYLSNEIHHRVKNDFQSISSMVFIQANDIKLGKVKEALLGVRDRILAMGQIHMLFYAEEGYLNMGLRNYLKKLVDNRFSTLSNQFNISGTKLSIELDEKLPDHINFQEAKQLGIIINELITNAYKYALKEDHFSHLQFSAKVKEGEALEIEVSDNGQGLDENFSIEKSASFGLKMIGYMCEKLKWKFSFQRIQDRSIFKVLIPRV